MTANDIINLTRRFYKADSEVAEEAAQSSYLAAFLDDEKYGVGLGWADLLSNRLVVVLGEPGSGKSTEFRYQTEILRGQRKQVFFVELGQLTQEDFQISMGRWYEHFLRWKKSGEDGYFFLDAVDESKLRQPVDFFHTLEKVRTAIEDRNLDRSRLILSSRISEWRPKTDLHEFRRQFILQDRKAKAGGGKSPESQQDVLVVHIAPLDRKRVRIYAESRGIRDSEGFIRALNENHAWEFTRRPWDVNALIEYWKRSNRLGSLTQLIEQNIRSGLQEKERRDASGLSPELSWTGAKSLAAAAIFCRNLSFRVPDANHISEAHALDPVECLPSDWPPAQSRALMNRALFDGAAYGCIRFHHRREQEYLAADWLNTAMENGCPLNRLTEILSFRHKGECTLRPSLVPVTAWLANGEKPHNDHVRGLILKSSPEIHFRFGDPGQLTLAYKRQLFNALADRYRDRKKVWIESETQALTRIAEQALAPDASRIILDKDLAVDFRAEILLMAWHGKLIECQGAAFIVLQDPAEDRRLKTYAAAMLRGTADQAVRAKVAEFVNEQETIDPRLAVIFIQTLYPESIGADGLVELVRKSQPVNDRNHEFMDPLKEHLREKLTPENAKTLLTALMRLVEAPPLIPSTYQVPISRDYIWLCGIFSEVLGKLLTDSGPVTEEEADLAARCIHMLEDYGRQNSNDDEKILQEVSDGLKKRPAIRRAYFWQAIGQFRLRNKGEPTWTGQIYGWNPTQLVQPQKADISWLKRDSVLDPNPANQTIAMRTALELWTPYSVQAAEWIGIFKTAITHRNLRAVFWKQTWVRLLFPFLTFWAVNITWRLLQKSWWERKNSQFGSMIRWVKGQFILHMRLRHLRSGKDTWNLAFLLHDHSQGQFQYSKKDWSKFGRRRGPLVAKAARRGYEASWLNYDPLLPHEKPVHNETDQRVILGLCGLHSLWIKGELDFANLSNENARRAARYAISELNGFADWLPDLVKVRPAAVREIFLQCIHGDWVLDAGHQQVNEVTSKILWGGEVFWPLVSSGMLEILKVKDPLNPQIFSYAMTILIMACDPNQLRVVKELIPQRISTYELGSHFFIDWLAIWLELDAEHGLSFLETRLAGLGQKAADDLMLRLCSRLQGERGSRKAIPSPDYLKHKGMRRLLPLIVRHIRVSDDIEHSGGVYTPGIRDHAQDFRGAMISSLVDDPSPDSHAILESLQNIPEMAPLRERLNHLAAKNIAQRGDLPTWTTKEVQQFSLGYEIEPKNEEGLFNIACDRLNDISVRVERSENSLRSEVQLGWKESDLRNWFQRKLKDQARGRYTIPQEAEIDLGQKPDLRFEHPAIPSAVPVEIKQAESWSTNKLLERLEAQLVGQYLRAENVHFGIFLLGRIDPAHRWNHPTESRRVDFKELLAILREKAVELEKQAGVSGIRIQGVDFTISAT